MIFSFLPKYKIVEWSEEDIVLITSSIVHCSDLSGPTKNFDLAFYFSQKVNEEFKNQVLFFNLK